MVLDPVTGHAADALLAPLLRSRRAEPVGSFAASLRHAGAALPGARRDGPMPDVSAVLKVIAELSANRRLACQ